jgi:HD-like signal output (HDOD) protein
MVQEVVVPVDVRKRALKLIDKLPRLSVSASQFLGALSKSEVENGHLVAIVQRDPMLAPRVLELANSGLFGRLQSIGSLSQAVARIGPTTMRRYGIRWTFGALFRHLPEMPHWSTREFTKHSEAVALLTDIVCDHLPIPRLQDSAFVAGLIHDIGKFAICSEASEKIDFILAARALSPKSVSEIERTVLNFDHAEISALAAEKWRLCDDICQAIRYHHDPDLDPNTDRLTLSTVLAKCDAFVNGLGLEFLSTRSDASNKLELPGYEKQVGLALQSFRAALETNGIVVQANSKALNIS